MGSLNSFLTRARITRPFSRPGPRKERIEERLALSKLALKTYGILSVRVTSEIFSASLSVLFSSSITQGPPIRTSFRGSPKTIDPSATLCMDLTLLLHGNFGLGDLWLHRSRDLQAMLFLKSERRTNKFPKNRVRPVRLGFELGMELDRKKP